MLARYKIFRGKRPPEDPLPSGIRKDTRWRTHHVLRPEKTIVDKFLETPSDNAAWKKFAAAYHELLEERFAEDQGPFDDLAKLAQDGDVHIGCSCPTQKNPDVNHCHTVLALKFMATKFPNLKVQLP